MNRTTFKFPFRILMVWIIGMVLAGGYFAVLDRIAPEILLREGETNHSDLYSLAERINQRVRRLRWVLPTDEKIRLLDEAIAALEKATAQRPNSQYYFWFLGQNLYLRAQLEEPSNPILIDRALEAFDTSWELTDREWEKPGVILARHYAENDQPQRAEEILERLLSVHPQSPQLYAGLLDLYLSQGRDSEAISLLNEKGESLSLTVSDRDRIAGVHLRNRDYPAAIEVLNNLVAGGGGSSRHRLTLAAALKAVGRIEESFGALRDFIEPLKRDHALRPAVAYGLERYPLELFPPLSYLWLEGKLGPLP